MEPQNSNLSRTFLPALVLFSMSCVAQGEDKESFFELKIRPVLVDTCFKCHGGETISHGLRVDSRDALLKGGNSGPAIAPGDQDKSLLIQAIRKTHNETILSDAQKLSD